MTKTTLYRRYRPSKFEDVVGQDHVTTAIKSSIKDNNFAHAYLFSGGRGTGKTSVARIFASEIGVGADDLYEIDAASNRGIDDIRDLRESVTSMPMSSPYKVYIIDEVHMLTKEAFNALLKTLEEPPPHVVFMLATTELDKLPETVISRCQTFTFRQPNQQTLRKVVESVAKKEGYSIDSQAANIISVLGEGSFRDTLGVLQKVITSFGKDKKITEEKIVSITGAPRSEAVNNFIDAVGYQDISKALSVVHTEISSGTDSKIILSLVLQKLRLILLIRFKAGLDKEIKQDVSDDDFKFLLDRAKDASFKLTAETLKVLLRSYDEIAHSAVAGLPLELAVMELLGEEDKEKK